MSLSCTVSEINGDFRRKSQIFPTRRVFNSPADGVSLRIWYRLNGSKNQNDALSDGRKSFKISLAV